MATLLKVLDNLADIKSAGGVALGLGTQESRTRCDGNKALLRAERRNIEALFLLTQRIRILS
jgi:hypothetical protein